MTFTGTAGNTNCTWCPHGYEATVKGSSICTKCGVGQFGVAHAIGCDNCEIGRYRQNDDEILTACTI